MATVDVARSLPGRLTGLVGRRRMVGGLVLRPCRWTHTVGIGYAVDVAYCDASMVVIDVACMAPWRVGRPRLRADCVVAAPAGAFGRWSLRRGDQLEIKG